MSKVLKIVLGLFGALVVLVLAAVIIIPLFVDPNDYRDDIARAVEEETGRSFEIEGEISLSVFPWLGLEVGAMRLGNPPGFGDAPFAEIRSAAVGAKLMPLLSRRLEVSTLRLDGLRIGLVQLADGSNNWADLAEGDEPEAAPPETEAAPGEASEGSGARLERIEGLRVTDAVVRYENRKDGSIVEAVLSELSTGELAPGQPFPLDAKASVVFDEGAMEFQATLGANVHFADEFDAVTIRELDLTGEGDAQAGRQGFSLQAPELRIALAGPAIDIDELELGFELSGPEVPGGEQSGRLRAPRLTADLEAQTLSIPSFSLEAAGLGASGEMAGASIVDAPALTGRMAMEEFSPRNLLERLGQPAPDTADPTALGRARFEAGFRAGTDQVEFQELRLLLDETTLTGAASIGLGEILRVRSELALDAIDLDRYLPPEPETEAETAPPAEDVELAFDWLEGLDLDASLRAGTVTINGLTLTDLQARAVAKDGVLTMQPLRAVLYGGEVQGIARLDAREQPATMTLEQTLSALQLQPFIQDLAGFDQLTGLGRLEAKLTTRAATTAELMRGLSGELAFDLADGALKGINLWYEIQRANALARGREPPERTSTDTEFRRLAGTATIRDGRLVNDDLVGGLPFLSLTGKGAIDLAEAALDYRLDATVIKQAVDEATGEVSELAGVSVPLRLSGELSSPSVSVDVGDLLRERATQEALRRLGVDEEDAKSAEQELKERASEGLRGLRDRLRRED
jgi:AsmA protein